MTPRIGTTVFDVICLVTSDRLQGSAFPLSCNKLVIAWPLVRICQYLAYGTRGHVMTNTKYIVETILTQVVNLSIRRPPHASGTTRTRLTIVTESPRDD